MVSSYIRNELSDFFQSLRTNKIKCKPRVQILYFFSHTKPPAICFLVRSMPFLSAGVVPEQEGEMEEERAFWSDAAGPNTFLNGLRASSPHAS